MASVYKPSYTTVDKKTGERVLRKTRKWYVEYRDAARRLVKVPGYVDKRATEALALELEQQAARGEMGMLDPFASHRRRLLTEHLDDFVRYLEGQDDCEKHVGQTKRYIEQVLTESQCTTSSNLSAQGISDWLTRHRKAGRSARTVNSYLNALKAFFRWMVKERRLADNPISHLSGLNAKADVRRERRSIDDKDVLAKWMDATSRGKPFRGLSGDDRVLLYSLAIYTGLRASLCLG
jgi:hypothetical protein